MDNVIIYENESSDRAYEMDSNWVERVLELIAEQDQVGLITVLNAQHPADVADLIEQIKPGQRSALMELWGMEMDGEVFAEMDETLSAELIEELPDEVVGEVLRDLETDDMVDLVEELNEGQKERVLESLEVADRVAVRSSLN